MKATQRDFASVAARAAGAARVFFFCGPDEAGAQDAAAKILALIQEDRLSAGAHLSAQKIADRLRLSRSPVNDALVRLVHALEAQDPPQFLTPAALRAALEAACRAGGRSVS